MPEPARRPVQPGLACLALLVALSPASAALAHARHHGHARGRAQVASTFGGEPKTTAIVMDAKSGEVLYAERADSPRYPASVTKVMTMYLAFDALASGRLHLTDPVVVSPLAAAQPATKLGLRAGESISVEDALHAMAVHSANDMAMAIAEKIGGTSSHFAELMTLKAQQLGMTNTRYVNPNGLPDNRQISTAHDLAILARAVLRDYPQYYGFFSQEQFTYRGKTMVNTNHLLGKMPGVDGLKTGFTNAAGFNLAASAVRNNHRLIAVVMGSSSGGVRNANVEGLLQTGFDLEDRRDHGEKILASQTYFETGGKGFRIPADPRARSGGPDAIDVVLTKTSAQTNPITVSSAMPKPAARDESHNWWVQLGRFRTRAAAHAQEVAVARRLPEAADTAESSIEGRRRIFHVRFSKLTQAAAKETCSAVRGRGLSCVIGDRA